MEGEMGMSTVEDWTHTRHTYTWNVKRRDEESRAQGSSQRRLRARVFECVRKRDSVCVCVRKCYVCMRACEYVFVYVDVYVRKRESACV
jgi:hypothetical protein